MRLIVSKDCRDELAYTYMEGILENLKSMEHVTIIGQVIDGPWDSEWRECVVDIEFPDIMLTPAFLEQLCSGRCSVSFSNIEAPDEEAFRTRKSDDCNQVPPRDDVEFDKWERERKKENERA